MIALIRVPHLSRYNELDVREEPIVSSAAGLFHFADKDFKVFDFHLNRSLSIENLISSDINFFIICMRGTGLSWKYTHLITLHLLKKTNAKIVIYGQTGKLRMWSNPDSQRISVMPHDEQVLMEYFDIKLSNFDFENGGLKHYPYALDIWDTLGRRKNLFKATIETTRGCHYSCSFCFINHGKNYRNKFMRRPTKDVISELKMYLDKGINKFWFFDSEFIGSNQKDYYKVSELLDAMANLRKKRPFETMIYSRSDTIDMYGDYAKLKSAGITSVLMGIESLNTEDLKSMKKSQYPYNSELTIRKLRDNEIFCNLSFVLFHKTASLNSIMENIKAMALLFNEENFVYLGQLQYFSFAFESDWSPVNTEGYTLSNKTQLHNSVSSTDSGNNYVTFDKKLEPLAEIFRILNYEQIRKTCELVIEMQDRWKNHAQNIHEWATCLSLFIINMMNNATILFKTGELNLNTIDIFEKWVYTNFTKYNSLLLPPELSHTITDKNGYWEGDWNGWEEQIPSSV